MPAAGQRVLAADFTAAVTDSDATDHLNVAEGVVAGSPEVGVTFTAPTSGKAQVIIGARVRDDGAASTPVIDWQLFEDDTGGTEILGTGSEERRMEIPIGSSTRTFNGTKTILVTGLTAGQVYYARLMHGQGAGGGATADVLHRQITVIPLPV